MARQLFRIHGGGLRWKLASVAVLCLAAALPTAFSAQAAASPGHTGVISGQLKVCKSPLTGKVPKDVVFGVGLYKPSHINGHLVAQKTVRWPYSFRFVTAAGSFYVSVPNKGYQDVPALVTAGHTVHVVLSETCDITAG
ncbi:MAG: hypothetical protein ABSG36_14815 [Acidimicrobiales bacterium]